MTVYILGCQPAIRAAWSSPNLRLDPAEPDNLGWYGWRAALAWLVRANPAASAAELAQLKSELIQSALAQVQTEVVVIPARFRP